MIRHGYGNRGRRANHYEKIFVQRQSTIELMAARINGNKGNALIAVMSKDLFPEIEAHYYKEIKTPAWFLLPALPNLS